MLAPGWFGSGEGGGGWKVEPLLAGGTAPGTGAGVLYGPGAGSWPRQLPSLQPWHSGPQQDGAQHGSPHGAGHIGPQQLPVLIGQQPLQQMLPQQHGVKALYW